MAIINNQPSMLAGHDINYEPLAPEHFTGVITLGNFVHGDNYLTDALIADYYAKSFLGDVNASWVALNQERVVGFRLTFAHNQWQTDEWCSPSLWPDFIENVCYFKCNTVAPAMQSKGIGSNLLRKSIECAKAQGANAGLAHIWLASPGNSAFKYFAKNGGQLIKKHANKWRYASIHEGYDCPVCSGYCKCEGAEMLLPF
ncbi:GNAT family N-acetyltransferase [Alteromonas sp. ALT199]|uniref:GNAT family N-acetyltransferase n=1 Tax=unclassified Alteromonas TaxID=2614992 RepID=UPI0020374027|nr:GNAT family N-acetyltransferase [Alteromonas sp. ALT199]